MLSTRKVPNRKRDRGPRGGIAVVSPRSKQVLRQPVGRIELAQVMPDLLVDQRRIELLQQILLRLGQENGAGRLEFQELAATARIASANGRERSFKYQPKKSPPGNC